MRGQRNSRRPELELHSHMRYLETCVVDIQTASLREVRKLQQDMLALQQRTARHHARTSGAMRALHSAVDGVHARMIGRGDWSAYDTALHELRGQQRKASPATVSQQADAKRSHPLSSRPPSEQAAAAAPSAAPSAAAQRGQLPAVSSAAAQHQQLHPPPHTSANSNRMRLPSERDLRQATRAASNASAAMLQQGHVAAAANTAAAARAAIPVAAKRATPGQAEGVIRRYNALCKKQQLESGTSGHRAVRTAFYAAELATLKNLGVTVSKSTMKGWCSSTGAKITTTGRRARATGATTSNTIEAVRLHRAATGNGAALSAVQQRVQEESSRMQISAAGAPTIMSQAALRRALILLRTQTTETTNPDDACRTAARKKAECYRNVIATFAAMFCAVFGQRRGVDAATAAKFPVHRSLRSNHDETTTVISNGHGPSGTEAVLVPWDCKDQQIRGATHQGSHLPLRFVLHLHAFHDLSTFVMHTIKLSTNQTTFLGDNGIGPFKPCYYITLPNPAGKPLIFRFIFPETKEKVHTQSGFKEFVLKNIATKRAELATLLNVDMTSQSEMAKLLSSVTTCDGAGGFLAATVEHILDGGADKDYEQFVKKASAATGILGIGNECDLGTFFKDFKAGLKQMERAYVLKHGAGAKVAELPELAGRAPLQETPAGEIDVWRDWETNPSVVAMKGAIFGKKASLGFTLQKWKLICRYVFICVMMQQQAFPPKKVAVAFARAGDCGENRKAVMEQSPGFQGLPLAVRQQVTSPAFLEEAKKQVFKSGFVTDGWFATVQPELPPGNYVGKDGKRDNRDRKPLNQRTCMLLNHESLAKDIEAKKAKAEASKAAVAEKRAVAAEKKKTRADDKAQRAAEKQLRREQREVEAELKAEELREVGLMSLSEIRSSAKQADQLTARQCKGVLKVMGVDAGKRLHKALKPFVDGQLKKKRRVSVRWTGEAGARPQRGPSEGGSFVYGRLSSEGGAGEGDVEVAMADCS
jgi:hypothetical protein